MAGRVLTITDIAPFILSTRLQARLPKRSIQNLGLCVSGGPDSMALAYLMGSYARLPGHFTRVTAFVVDHKARPESTNEAEQVKKNLSDIGIRSKVLTMTWSPEVDPLELTDFELQARLKRYHLLAQAAVRENTKFLFLGHHQDDQVETVLMRLIRNRNTSLRGLAGMATTSPVPSAFDLFGIHTENAGTAYPSCAEFPPSPGCWADAQDKKSRYKGLSGLAFPGGIRLQRPLLRFSKQDLVATCEANGVQYVIDPTNKDPQTSLRNAVRHLKTNYQLPRAFSNERILKLQNVALGHLAEVRKAGETALATFKLENLDIRAGTLKLRVPYVQHTSMLDIQGYGYALGKIIEMVTPNVRLENDQPAPRNVVAHFCNLKHTHEAKNSQPRQRNVFNHERVHFSPSPNGNDVWVLSRQPMRSMEVRENTCNFIVSLRRNNQSVCKSAWLLWDNRFWVRLSGTDADLIHQIIIRPLHPDDMAIINEQIRVLDDNARKTRLRLQSILQEVAPGKIRYTLPVLTLHGQILAFPSLKYKLVDVFEKLGVLSLKIEVVYNSFSLLHYLQGQHGLRTQITGMAELIQGHSA